MNKEILNELIKLSLNKEEAAFRKIVEYFQGMVYSFAYRMICDEDEAKDITQETFIRVWLHLPDYDCEKKFSTWIYSITSNLCLDRLKSIKRTHEEAYPEQLITELISDEDIEREMIISELANIILTLTDELTAKQKIVFTLRYLEDLSVKEIIQVTGMTAEKIKSNLYLAKKTISNKIEKIK
jgi:RNA polymerase sigma factor, sigma-70 family